MERKIFSGWDDVDTAGSPERFVRCLDNITSFEMARAQKARSLALLEPTAGDRLLEVGCGPGEDSFILAEKVGSEGRVVGMDVSAAMVEEASRRGEERGLSVEFHQGDVHALAFSDDSFDGCRADRVFQHLRDPHQALSEMIRVARPGARIVVVDPDWETLLVDHDDQATTRKLLNLESDTHHNGWSGRRLYALFKDCGLEEVGVFGDTWLTNDIAIVKATFNYPSLVEEAVAEKVVSKKAAKGWLKHLETRVAEGRFFGAITVFTAWGRKPAAGQG